MMMINKMTFINGATRRRRNPDATREVILGAARTVLASDGPDGLSVSKVAHLAGVNRGTAYQHFETRSDLVSATVASVSEQLSLAVFGGVDEQGRLREVTKKPVYEIVTQIVEYAIDNPELARIWLFEVLASDSPESDVFFQQFERATQGLAHSELGEDDIDTEALSVLMLAGYFLWPVWVRSRAKTESDRREMARRMSREVLRLSLHGTLRAEAFPPLDVMLEAGLRRS